MLAFCVSWERGMQLKVRSSLQLPIFYLPGTICTERLVHTVDLVSGNIACNAFVRHAKARHDIVRLGRYDRKLVGRQLIRAGSEKSDSRYKWNSCLTLA